MKITLCAFCDEAGSTVEEQIKALKENNIGLAEVRSINGKNVSKFTEAEAKEYSAKFTAAGIKVWSLGSPLCKVPVFTPLGKELEKAKNLCTTAKIMGAQNIRAFSFYTFLIPNGEKKAFDKLSAIKTLVESSGINFCHENDTGLYGASVENLQKLIKRFPDLKLIYDPANFVISKQEPSKTVSLFADKAFYFHMKDAKGKSVVPAGYGDAELKKLIFTLKTDTVFSLEPHLVLFKGCEGFNKAEYDLSSKRGRFDCAVNSLRRLLADCGFEDKGTYFEKKDV